MTFTNTHPGWFWYGALTIALVFGLIVGVVILRVSRHQHTWENHGLERWLVTLDRCPQCGKWRATNTMSGEVRYYGKRHFRGVL